MIGLGPTGARRDEKAHGHPLIPRETDRWRKPYKRRGAVEREFGRLNYEYALSPLRVRASSGSGSTPTHNPCQVACALSQAARRATRGIAIAAKIGTGPTVDLVRR
jgi:hypothetical protein